MTKHELKVNLGCGKKLRHGYVNCDHPDADIDDRGVKAVDLLQPLPWLDGVVSEVLLEDVLEHLWPDESDRLLAECYRVLCPGGKLVVVTPDLDAITRNHGVVAEEVLVKVLFGWYAHGGERERSAAMVHKQAWSAGRLNVQLRKYGFSTGPGLHPSLVLADREHPEPCLSMAVVAFK